MTHRIVAGKIALPLGPMTYMTQEPLGVRVVQHGRGLQVIEFGPEELRNLGYELMRQPGGYLLLAAIQSGCHDAR